MRNRALASAKNIATKRRQHKAKQLATLAPKKWQGAINAPEGLKRLRLEAYPHLNTQLNLLTELRRPHSAGGPTNTPSSFVIPRHAVLDLTDIDLKNDKPDAPDGHIRTKYDVLPRAKRQWLERPLEPYEYEDLLKRTGTPTGMDHAPDGAISYHAYKTMERTAEAKERVSRELAEFSCVENREKPFKEAEERPYSQRDAKKTTVDWNHNNPVARGSITGIPEAELYERCFNNANPENHETTHSLRHRIKKLERGLTSNMSSSKLQDVRALRSKQTSTTRALFPLPCVPESYVAPKHFLVEKLLLPDFRLLLSYEYRMALKDPERYKDPIWWSILVRLRRRMERCSLLNASKIFHCIARVHESCVDPGPDREGLMTEIIAHNERKLKAELTVLPFVLHMTGLKKLRRFQDAFRLLRCTTFLWPALPSPHLVKMANAIGNLGLGGHLLAEPLRLVLLHRVPYLADALYPRISAIAALSLFSDDGLQTFLRACMEHWKAFPSGHKELHILELFLRLCRPELYETFSDEMKGFLEYVRLGLPETAESSANNDTDPPRCPTPDEALLSSPTKEKPSLPDSTDDIRDTVRAHLKNLGVTDVRANVMAGPFQIPLYSYKQRQLVIDLLDSTSFLRGTQELCPAVQLRHHLLRSMGFRVCVVRRDRMKPLSRERQMLYLKTTCF